MAVGGKRKTTIDKARNKFAIREKQSLARPCMGVREITPVPSARRAISKSTAHNFVSEGFFLCFARKIARFAIFDYRKPTVLFRKHSYPSGQVTKNPAL